MKQVRFLCSLFILLSLGFTQVYAQCEECAVIEQKVDYCFTDARFGNRCAQFIDKSAHFYFSTKKNKVKELPMIAEDQDQTDYLLTLAAEKKNKLSAIDILFLKEAIEKWLVEKTKIGYTFTESGLGIKILEKGNGKTPSKGDEIVVHYKGMLENGEVFDSSFERGEPITIPIGVGRVIEGWDEALTTLPVGTKAILRIPSELGYGSRAMGPIPANALLYFEVELLDIVE